MIDLSGLFSTFDIVKRALNTQQYALNTTAHNIANASTEGYSRQRVTMEASTPEGNISMNSSSGPGQIGTGVEITEVTRARDQFLDSQIRNETSTSENYKARENFLSEVESIFQEPSNVSLNSALSDMFNSWQNLSGNPTDSTLKTGVVQSSLTATDDINHIYEQLNTLESNSDELVQDQVYSFSGTVSQIEDLNKQIRNVEISGNNPNDLLDKQDLLIDNLSKMMNISVSRNEFGEAYIKSGDTTIVGENQKSLSYVKSISAPDDNGDYTITYYNNGDTNDLKAFTVKSTDSNFESLKDAKIIWTDSTSNTIQKADPQDGSMNGYISVRTEIDSYKNQLDALSRAIATSVNTIINDGKTPTTMPLSDPPTPTNGYVPFFTNTTGADDGTINASNITVNPSLISDPTLLLQDGDGDTAIAAAQLTDTNLFMNEFLDSQTSKVSGDLTGYSGTAGDNLIIDSNGNTYTLNISEGETLNDIAQDINNYDTGKSDNQKLFVKAAVENNRLIIESVKEGNTIDLEGSLDNLKFYPKDSMIARNDNSVVNNYVSETKKITDEPGGSTILGYYGGIISKLGSSEQQAKNIVSSQGDLLSQLNLRKQSVSGVSTDEEMTDMIQYQRSYEAAAKMVNVIDELLDTVVNGLIK